MSRIIVLAMVLLAGWFATSRICLGQTKASPPKGFLEIAYYPSISAAQEITIAAIIRSVNAKDADDAYKKVMAADSLVLYGADSDFITDITPLSSFTNLKTLVLDNNHIVDLAPLAKLTKLETLRLELNRISDISPLQKLVSLQSLQIDGNQISDIRPLAGLTSLRTLWITGNKVSDIAPLANLHALNDLYLSGNPVKDLTTLNRMSVSDLRLSDIGIEDISALRDLNQNITALIHIDLSKNKIRNVDALAHLDRVSSLDLGDNRITDISAFAHSKFTYIDLHNNLITDVSAIASLAPSSVDVRSNPIKDYKPLVALLNAKHAEIRADVGFDKALSESVPVQPELAKSPVIGRWRCALFNSGEFGILSIIIRLEANGLIHMTMCPPGIRAEAASTISTRHGHFSVKGDIVTFSSGGEETPKQQLRFDGKQLLLKDEKTNLIFRKVE